ncbi:hypothetical protein NONO_c06310 [Nocardia nova SH22a]|uniref:Low molecular weight antigen MTB12-like C-terminal domain-containing protein n=1 Tax=Nocardia nova SH22a TaxID=1415166 RepID=W5T906_9NOCA|nr:hypothetical protein [Nocardia nova]AHH15443.1 hypothetical protein NONO_c06310 [Nocardia nova SH22a]
MKLVRMLAVVAGVVATVVTASVATADPGHFRITREVPTLADLNEQVRFLVETPASDEAKAANLEGGMNAVVVPRTVYNLGLFRAPKGWNEVTGPETHQGNEHTAILHSGSAGRPEITMRVSWKRVDGAWKLANSSLCEGVKTVGLPIPCTF